MNKSKKQNKKKPKNKSTLKNADKEVGYNKDERKDDSMENGDFKLKSPAKLNNMNFKPVEIIPDVLDKATGQDKTEEIIEEIADDMLHLMEQIKKIELKQDEQAEKIERLCQIIQETRQEHTIELDKLRRDLIEERKALSVRSVEQDRTTCEFGLDVLECTDTIVFRENSDKDYEFLLLHRQEFKAPDKGWEYPKGGMEYHETINEGVIRELPLTHLLIFCGIRKKFHTE